MVDNRLPKNMKGGSFKFSDLEKKKKKTKKKKSDPSVLGYPARKSNINIIMKGTDGNLYKNKKYKKTKRWYRIHSKKINSKKKKK